MSSDGPRQHYMFGHRALPSLFFGDPGWLFSVVHGKDCQRFLGDVWARAGEHSGAEGRSSGEGLRGETFVLGPYLFALIHLPPPTEMTDCHMVAVVARFVDPDKPSSHALEDPRCFTLELGVDVHTGKPCTFLCEWTPLEQHRNLGGGPAASASEFVAAVVKQLQGASGPR